MATKQNPAAGSGHDIVTKLAVEMIGVAAFALLAGISPQMGSVMVTIMAGIMLAWALIHLQQLQNLVGKL